MNLILEKQFLTNDSGFIYFEWCYFIKSLFNNVKVITPAYIIDSKFFNSKKSLEFEEEVDLDNILNQIEQLYKNKK